MRPRRDKFQNLVRDRDETESFGTFSLETETRPRRSPISVGRRYYEGEKGKSDNKCQVLLIMISGCHSLDHIYFMC